MSDRKIELIIRDIGGHAERFESLRAFRQFCKSEMQFWELATEKAGSQAVNQLHFSVAGNLKKMLIQLDDWEKSSVVTWDEPTLNSQMNWLIQNFIPNPQSNWLWSGHPFVDSYLRCFVEHGPNSAQAFIEYIVRKSTSNIANAEWFHGYMFAYEYQNQSSEILRRRNTEKASLSRLRDQFVEVRNKLFGETDVLKQQFSDWDVDNRQKHIKRLSAQKRLNRAVVRSNEASFNASLEQMNADLEGWNARVGELEVLYGEKLKLEKPADYWKKAARRYGVQGSLWAVAIIVTTVVGLLYFREFFITWLQGEKLPLQLNSLQGVVLFGSIAAVYAFLLRVLSRLAFSAFHLMRDAEEREQLTYLYLSLSNESAVDEKSREIVLQALFSRSETGLLVNESGPTMPGVDMIKAAAGRGGG